MEILNGKRVIVPLALGAAGLVILLAIWPGQRFESPDSGEAGFKAPERAAGEAVASGDGLRRWLDEAVSEEGANRRDAWLARGIQLAKARRMWMKGLMHDDPRAAAEAAFRWDEWLGLPEEVRAWVEKPFSVEAAKVTIWAECDLEGAKGLRAPMASPGDDGISIEVELEDGVTREGLVYGQRKGDGLSRRRSPAQGIQLDDLAVLREDLVQRVAGGELAAVERLFEAGNPDVGVDFMTGEAIGAETRVAGLFGGRVFYFGSEESLNTFEAKLRGLENGLGPDNGAGVFFEGLEEWAASYNEASTFNWLSVLGIAESLTRTWTGTAHTAFIFTVSFPDLPANTVTAAELEPLFEGPASATLNDMSYGKTWIDATIDATAWVSMYPSTYYLGTTDMAGNPPGDGMTKIGQIGDEVITAIELANPGLDLETTYDVIATHFPNLPGIRSAAAIGGDRMRLNGTKSVETIVHELGHNYGNVHSSFWQSLSTDPVDPGGTNKEYGNRFDVMGVGGIPHGHLRAQAKVWMGWLEPSQWMEVTSSGTHRLYRFDAPDTSPAHALRALKIDKTGTQHYWVSLRRGHPGPESYQLGATVTWQKGSGGGTKAWLIDLKSDATGDRYDGGLALGQTYSDTAAGVHLTALEMGGSSPNEWIDIHVELGNDPGNAAPMGTFTGPATANAREEVIFSMTATDSDDTELVYHWDFGDGMVFPSEPEVRHAFAAGGTYTVSCTVSDTRGGTYSDAQVVTVSDPLETWTQRTSGTTRDLRDIAVNDAGTLSVVVGGTGTILSSPDGTTWTDRSLSPGTNIFLRGVCWDQTLGLWVAVGAKSGSGAIYTSPDGINWMLREETGNELWKVACDGNGTVVAAGVNHTRRSTDGINWTQTIIVPVNSWRHLAYGDGTFVMAAEDGGGEYSFVLTSATGSGWTNQSVGLCGVPAGSNVRGLRFCSDRFLMSGTGRTNLRYSLDGGETFLTEVPDDSLGAGESPNAPRYHCPGLAYGNGVYFAAGLQQQGGTVDQNLASLDGAHWHRLTTPSQINRTAAAFIPSTNTFVTVGNSGNIWQSNAVTAPTGGWGTWQSQNLAALGHLRGWGQDADGDGDSNGKEYAAGTRGGDAGSFVDETGRLFTNAGNATFFEIVVPRNGIKPDVVYEVWRSTDLSPGGWSLMNTLVMTDTAAELIVRSTVKLFTDPIQFLQFVPRLGP